MHTTLRHAAAQRRLIWPPEPGFFALRLARGGWRVPARIHHAGGVWWAEIDGIAGPADPDPAYARGVDRIWHGGIRIQAESEYRYMLALKAWAAANDPRHPCLHPTQPIDRMRLSPLLPPGLSR